MKTIRAFLTIVLLLGTVALSANALRAEDEGIDPQTDKTTIFNPGDDLQPWQIL